MGGSGGSGGGGCKGSGEGSGGGGWKGSGGDESGVRVWQGFLTLNPIHHTHYNPLPPLQCLPSTLARVRWGRCGVC